MCVLTRTVSVPDRLCCATVLAIVVLVVLVLALFMSFRKAGRLSVTVTVTDSSHAAMPAGFRAEIRDGFCDPVPQLTVLRIPKPTPCLQTAVQARGSE